MKKRKKGRKKEKKQTNNASEGYRIDKKTEKK